MDAEHAIVVDDDDEPNLSVPLPLPSDTTNNVKEAEPSTTSGSDYEEKRPVPLMLTPAKTASPKTAGLLLTARKPKKRIKLQVLPSTAPSSKARAVSDMVPPRLSSVRFTPAQWPPQVVNLRAHYNPDSIAMPFMKTFGMCQCADVCRQDSCRNAQLHIFCTPNCCPYGGECGNGLTESKNLVLVNDTRTRSLAVIASKAIPSGVVIGQYLGRLTLERPRVDRPAHRGYRLIMREGPKNCGSWRLCIDAEMFGSILRFVNHSCVAAATFKEVSNGAIRTVVMTTTREICAGEEVTVDYGDDLWFLCACGEDNCVHRNLPRHST